MEIRLNCKMVKDDQRTIIVIEGATSERDKLVADILNIYCGDPQLPQDSADTSTNNGDLHSNPELTIQNVEGLEPIPEVEDTSIPSMEEISQMEDFSKNFARGIAICGGKYKGMTTPQALNRDREVALVELFEYAKTLPNGTHEKEEIVKHCKQYMYELPNSQYLYQTKDDKLNFLATISKMADLQSFIMGYRHLNDFIESAQDAEIDRVFESVTQFLQDRATQTHTVRLLNA